MNTNKINSNPNENLIFRKNIIDNKLYLKKKMVRIVITKDKKTLLDLKQNISGRGIYVNISTIKDQKQLMRLKQIINRYKGNYNYIAEPFLELITRERDYGEKQK